MNARERILYWLLGGLSIFSCSDEQLNRFGELEARLVAYDEMNVERTSFWADSDITLALNLVNTSSSDIEAGTYWDYCGVYEVEEFLLVNKLAVSGPDKGTWQTVGKAYVPPVFCQTIGYPVVVHANGEQTVCGAKWTSNPDNAPLSSGKYYTALSHALTIKGQTHEVNLRLDFEIR